MYDGYVAHHYAYMAKVVQDEELTCFDDAIGNVKWEKAMDEEMAALYANETWDLVPFPESKNMIGCKWVKSILDKVEKIPFPLKKWGHGKLIKEFVKTLACNISLESS